MSLKKLGGETIIYGLANILPRLLTFVLVTPFLTRAMVSEDYGVVGVLFMYIGLLTALLVFRMDTVVFRFASRAEHDARAVFVRAQTFVVAVVIVVVGLGLLLSNQVADWIHYPDRPSYVVVFLLAVAFDCLSAVPLARLRLERRAWLFVAVNLGATLLSLALLYLLLDFWPDWGTLLGLVYDPNYQVTYYLATIAIPAALRYLVLLLDGLYRYRLRPAKRLGNELLAKDNAGHAPVLRRMLIYSAPLTLVGVAGIFNALSGPYIIQEFMGGTTTENLYWSGQFSAALKLAVILNLFVTAFNYAAEPFFFRQAGNDLDKADKQIFADATRAYALVGVLACAGIMIFLPWLKVFIGDDLQEGLVVLPFLLAGNFCFGLYSNFSIAYKLTDKTYLGGAIALAGSLVCAGVGIFFIGAYGIIAPAAAMFACYLLMCALAWGVTWRYFPVAYPIGRIVVYVMVSCAVVYGALSQVQGFVGRIAVFLGLLAILGWLEKNWLRSVLRRKQPTNPAQ
ncbi:lipopolysaccharide biosynthesis protein [Neolewinella antarctica]|uniref:O-antigen/teichoic acid export membrane protein n=1 Tax=Neolewinella antarctica TaxID=442734 RepID=A0ABX0XAD3_9BACT|nr:lipopolysaccharide biosynthesis protein [Neolewinella antarctica]NJC26213.1 O-antigen/teichoic acid export membrane protein [Neolewinella antarctica]